MTNQHDQEDKIVEVAVVAKTQSGKKVANEVYVRPTLDYKVTSFAAGAAARGCLDFLLNRQADGADTGKKDDELTDIDDGKPIPESRLEEILIGFVSKAYQPSAREDAKQSLITLFSGMMDEVIGLNWEADEANMEDIEYIRAKTVDGVKATQRQRKERVIKDLEAK